MIPLGFTRAASARPRRRRDGLLECVGAVEQSTVPSVHPDHDYELLGRLR